MDRLNFKTNWNNKLNNKVFSTIRPFNDKKYAKDCIYDIYLNQIKMGTAKIIFLKTVNIDFLSQVECYLDTGYGKAETIEIINKMYKGEVDRVHYLILKFEKDVSPPLLTGGC